MKKELVKQTSYRKWFLNQNKEVAPELGDKIVDTQCRVNSLSFKIKQIDCNQSQKNNNIRKFVLYFLKKHHHKTISCLFTELYIKLPVFF